MLPHFKIREIPFGGNTSSEDLNKMNKEMALELANIFEELTSNDIAISETRQFLKIENGALNNKINELEDKVKNLKRIIEDNDGPLEKSYITFQNPLENSFGVNLSGYKDVDERERCKIDYSYNYVSLPLLHSQSKTFLRGIDGSAESIFVPDDIRIETKSPTYPYCEVKENNPIYALDQKEDTQWRKEFIYNDAGNAENGGVEVEITIKMPTSIASSMLANTLLIDPFPSSNITIKDIQYRSLENTSFKPLDILSQYYDGNGNFHKIGRSQNTIIVFDEKNISEIKITLHQENLIGNKYVIGLNNLALYRNIYHERGKVLTRFNVKESMGSNELKEIAEINNYRLFFHNTDHERASGALRLIEDIKVYAVSMDGSLRRVHFGDNLPSAYNQDFWIEITLKQSPQIPTPLLKGLEIEYKLKD